MIYLDHAATTKIRPEVLETMLPYLEGRYGNASSVYALGREAHAALDQARVQLQRALNAEFTREVFFTGCGSESDNWAILGAALAQRDKRHIITTKVEHHAVLKPCEFLKEFGYEITYLDVDEYGMVNPQSVRAAIREDTALVSIMFANNEVGTINPIREIGAVAREAGVLFHTDAVQAAGHVPIDVRNMNIDLLSLSAHKFYAPKGVGALYIRNGVPIQTFLHGGAQERKRRAGTENVAGIAAMGKAIELACLEMPRESERTQLLRDHMIRRAIRELPGCKINGHLSARLPGNVNLSIAGVSAQEALFHLDQAGIACSSGSACTSGAIGSSHVLIAMGLSEAQAKNSLRFTLGRENTVKDIDITIDTLKWIVQKAAKNC